MSTIIAYVKGNKSYLLADSQISFKSTKLDTFVNKIWKQGEFLIGSVGKVRFTNIVRTMEFTDFMPFKVAEKLKYYLKSHDYNIHPSDGLLYIYRNKIIVIYSDFSYHVFEEFASIGSGGVQATGILNYFKKYQSRIIRQDVDDSLILQLQDIIRIVSKTDLFTNDKTIFLSNQINEEDKKTPS